MTPREGRPVRRRLVTLALTGLLAGTGGGCAAIQDVIDTVPQPPGPEQTAWVPTRTAEPSSTLYGNLSPDGFASAQRMAVRIRNVGCGTLSTGSGFAIGPRTLMTNRHVVADSAELQVSTYDGRDVQVEAASTAALADLALVRTAQDLPDHPELADADPEFGDSVTVIGYPLGGELTVSSGRVVGSTTDPLNENLGEVLVTDAEVEPGSSGSAVLDSEGRVIGVVYAKNAADQSFIVPVSTLTALLEDEDAFTPVAACE